MNNELNELAEKEYEYGFTTDIHTETLEKGLNEEIVRRISALKEEPEWLLEFRLKAYRYWQKMPLPEWGHLQIPEIDFQAISYYANPKGKKEEQKKITANENKKNEAAKALEEAGASFLLIEGALSHIASKVASVSPHPAQIYFL